MEQVFGYCRISTPRQSITRQIRNIQAAFPDAVIICETACGSSAQRTELEKLLHRVMPGDTVVFDSVSRMSRCAEDGTALYMQLFDRGIRLIFLKEHYIDTDTYRAALEQQVRLTGDDVDDILSGVNSYLRKLAARQIRIAFDQAEKEVTDLRQRTREGIETARRQGKQIGQKPGSKLHVRKADRAKAVIMHHAKAFGGSLSDRECILLAGCSRNSYYKYKAELRHMQAGAE